MFVTHVALQGCLRASNVEYGVTPDTGGHIKYLLELVEAAAAEGVDRQDVVVRRFDDPRLGRRYARRVEEVRPNRRIVRIDGVTTDYLSKEDLHTEHDALVASFLSYLRALADKPDVIHAHYADAGVLALAAKRALGIPYVFTAHSLGQVKVRTLDGTPPPPSLTKRIATEEEVIGEADRIIVSSRDEAEVQYPLYRSARNDRIRVIPPGCQLGRFQATRSGNPAFTHSIERFLSDPSKPPILAIARPVRKKNLVGLLKAFGEDPGLQARANLVLFAGTRQEIRQEKGEHGVVLSELLYLIDQYDLWGKVAFPKHHHPADIPRAYQYAAARGGVFVNAAFNEPFGLTLLEAAAAGLPVVATRHGGPNDIVGKCRNGLLVDPANSAGIAEAIVRLMDDPDLYEECAREGRARVSYYSWQRHAQDYRRELGAITMPVRRPRITKASRFSHLLVSDIDNTLVGCPQSLATFSAWRKEEPAYCFAIATGRSLHGAVDILREQKAPVPTILVTSVGSEIYFADDADLRCLRRDDDWTRMISRDWDAGAVTAVLSRLPFLSPQGPVEQTPHKRSYFVNDASEATQVERVLQEAGLSATVVHSHERYLDVLPPYASKGAALRYLAGMFDIPGRRTIAAGDSGNDLLMLKEAGLGIVVANHTPELEVLRSHRSTYFSRAGYAGGIVEGLDYARRTFDA